LLKAQVHCGARQPMRVLGHFRETRARATGDDAFQRFARSLGKSRDDAQQARFP
jgi:hypothetical protein